MKIVLLLSRIEQTGVTTHTIDLAEGLVKKGHQVRLITGGKIEGASNRVDDFHQAFVDLGVEIKEFKTPKGSLVRKGVDAVASVIEIMRDIRAYQPNVIHSQSPYMTFIPWFMRLKFTTTIHILYLKKNFKYKNPNHMIAISQESYQFAKEVFGMPEKHTSLIHHGVSERFSKPINNTDKAMLSDRLGIPKGNLVIGFVGSISLRKGSDIMIKALQGLNDSAKSKISFVFLGGTAGSDEHAWLKDLIEKAEIENMVHMVPFEDPKPFYDLFDVFVLPSRMESFPLATIEAMMSECCPVRSNVEGAYEQIEHKVNGMLFETENVQGLTETLETLIFDDTLRMTLAKNAKEKALQEFTIPAMTEKTLKVYDKIKMN